MKEAEKTPIASPSRITWSMADRAIWGEDGRSVSGFLSGDELLEADLLDHFADDSVLELEVVDLEL